MADIQPLPDEIQALVDKEQVIIAQCDSELARLGQQTANWNSVKQLAQTRIAALKDKYAVPNTNIWPPKVVK